MLQFHRLATLPSITLCVAAGCMSGAVPPDEAANDSDQSALTSDDAYTYFAITADLRKCASPVCGGWFVSRLSRSTTTCQDGRIGTSCYTPVLDWSATGLTATQQAPFLDACNRGAVSSGVYAIVRGRFARGNATPRPDLGRFLITEAWLAEGDVPSDGTFVKLADNGIRCFAAPCPSTTELAINMSSMTNIAALDWTPSGFDQAQIDECTNDLFTPSGLLVAGYRYSYTQNGTTAQGRTVTAAFERLTPSP
jgi:hypothetical protein